MCASLAGSPFIRLFGFILVYVEKRDCVLSDTIVVNILGYSRSIYMITSMLEAKDTLGRCLLYCDSISPRAYVCLILCRLDEVTRTA